MLEKIQAILDKYGVEEVWSTADRFKRTHTDDFFFVGKDSLRFCEWCFLSCY